MTIDGSVSLSQSPPSLHRIVRRTRRLLLLLLLRVERLLHEGHGIGLAPLAGNGGAPWGGGEGGSGAALQLVRADRGQVDPDPHLLGGGAAVDAAVGGNVLVVAADADADVPLLRPQVVGGVDPQPA